MLRVRELHFAAIAKTTVCCGQFAAYVRERKVPTPSREGGAGEGRGESGHKFFLPSFLPRAERSQLRLLIQGGRDRGPKTKRKTFVNQDVGLSVHLAGNELIRISIFFDLDSPPPSFPSPHFPASLPSPPAPAPLHFPTSSRPNSTWTLSG